MKALHRVVKVTPQYSCSSSFLSRHHPFPRQYISATSSSSMSNANSSEPPLKRATPKTLMDFFPQPRNPKRRKTSAADQDCSSASPPVMFDDKDPTDSSRLTSEQRSRMELNMSLARWRRNLRICSEKVSKAKDGRGGHAKLEELLVEETWLEALPGELQKPYAKSLCKFIEAEICAGASVPIYPPPHLIFNSLNSITFDKVKVVILGQDPYHGPGQAMGLAFSVPEGVKIPSSLVNIFKELQQDLGCSIPLHGNLEKWAAQGVLLLNTVLTVRGQQANSHAKKGWEQFTDTVIRAVSQKKRGVVFLLWGNSAKEKSRHFSQTNKILEMNGESPIDWQL
ncbi:hypothetical protein Dimus_009966 [Dionaea muscipula]